MDINDTKDAAMSRLIKLIFADKEHYEELGIFGLLEDCYSDGMFELNREVDVYDEEGNLVPPADENEEHKQTMGDVL